MKIEELRNAPVGTKLIVPQNVGTWSLTKGEDDYMYFHCMDGEVCAIDSDAAEMLMQVPGVQLKYPRTDEADQCPIVRRMTPEYAKALDALIEDCKRDLEEYGDHNVEAITVLSVYVKNLIKAERGE